MEPLLFLINLETLFHGIICFFSVASLSIRFKNIFTTDKVIQYLIILYKQCYEMIEAFFRVACEKGKLHFVEGFSGGDFLS